ncbi:MAG: Uma2 family endonuclease, partial [Gammaproteobacteria bacterium]|nr:Uma2 family endonuclease [Gammaproteobacteria bacterium]
SFGGRSQITRDDYLQGAPELIVEVAASSAAYDLHGKRKAYCRNGVREYVIWRIHKKCVDWFVLRKGKYIALKPDDAGNIHSRVFPGLTLAVPALLKGDLAGVLAELQQGLQTPEHKAFAASLSNYAAEVKRNWEAAKNE